MKRLANDRAGVVSTLDTDVMLVGRTRDTLSFIHLFIRLAVASAQGPTSNRGSRRSIFMALHGRVSLIFADNCLLHLETPRISTKSDPKSL